MEELRLREKSVEFAIEYLKTNMEYFRIFKPREFLFEGQTVAYTV